MDNFPCVLPSAEDDLASLEESLSRWRADHLAWKDRVFVHQIEPIPPLHLGEEYTELHLPSSSRDYRVLANRTTTVPECSPPTDCPHLGVLPSRPRPDAFAGRSHDIVHIICPLRIDPDTNSQIYYGALGPALDDPLSTKVVLKIYQCSMLPWCNLASMPAPDPWDNSFQQFRQEYWAYERLKPLQGSVVPHVYGFFKVRLPNDEPSIALVMEYVPHAEDATRYIKRAGRKNENALDVVGCGILRAIHAIQACGVAWDDFATRNILFHSKRPANPVIIDFALVQGVEWFYRDWPLQALPTVLSGLGFDLAESKAWLEGRLKEPYWASLFDVPL